jgi:beta-mannanase
MHKTTHGLNSIYNGTGYVDKVGINPQSLTNQSKLHTLFFSHFCI